MRIHAPTTLWSTLQNSTCSTRPRPADRAAYRRLAPLCYGYPVTYKRSFFILLFSGATLFAACGGVAIIDGNDSNSGGAGGSGSVTTTVANSSSVMSSSSGAIPQVCEVACDSLAECGGGPSNCLLGCQERLGGPCGEQHRQWLSCSLELANTMCGAPAGVSCEPELTAYLNCSEEVVGELSCSVSPDGCECSIFVSPGFEKSQTCDQQGCECFIGDELVGTCSEPDVSCVLPFTCCAGLLFTGGT